jgi:RNA polymerase sigma-70 factor (ECF subfamily)
MTEANLIERARSGDEAAWENLIQQHQQAVFRLAYLMLGESRDAEDVAQEAFIRAFRHLNHYDPARPLMPWLLGITANLARNRRRAWGRYLHHIGRLARLVPEEMADPESEVARNTNAQALWQAVQRLETTDQEIIYLRYFLELSVEETAATLNIASGTVKSRLSRALDRLRGVVRDEFPVLWRVAND